MSVRQQPVRRRPILLWHMMDAECACVIASYLGRQGVGLYQVLAQFPLQLVPAFFLLAQCCQHITQTIIRRLFRTNVPARGLLQNMAMIGNPFEV
jgi:hypothetical protein